MTVSEDTNATVWDLNSGIEIYTLPHAAAVNAARFSGDGQVVVTASDDLTAKIWILGDNEHPREVTLARSFPHGSPVKVAEFSPDGQWLLTGGADGNAKIWRLSPGEPSVIAFKHSDFIAAGRFAPDGLRAATASHDYSARVMDLRSPDSRIFGANEPLRHDYYVYGIEFSPDGRRILTASVDKTARLWDAAAGSALPRKLIHGGPVRHAQFSADGKRIVTSSDDGTARVWDVQTALPAQTLLHGNAVRFAAWSPGGELIATASRDRTVKLWNVSSGELVHTFPHARDCSQARFSPDGKLLATVARGSGGHSFTVWDLQSKEPLCGPFQHQSAIKGIRFSQGNKYLISISDDFTALLVDLTSQPVRTNILFHDNNLTAADFSSDSSRVLTASKDKTLCIWETKTGSRIGSPMKHDSAVITAKFSADQQTVYSVSQKSVWSWDPVAALGTPQRLKDHSAVRLAQFSPDGRRLVTVSSDNLLRIWDTATGLALSEMLGTRAAVHHVTFSPDGQLVVAALDDHSAMLWEVPSAPLPAAPWLARLAEAVAGQRLDASDNFEPVSTKELLELRQELTQSTERDFYANWARWFFADRSTRPVSPFSTISVPEYVRRRIEENTTAALYEAVRLAPQNGLAYARLAQRLFADAGEDPPRLKQADFYSRHALKLSPSDGEVLAVRAQIEQTLASTKE